MTTWNYRVFKEKNGDYIIREVFYAEDGSIIGCTENAVEPYGESLEELARDLNWFKEAITLPVLTLDDIPQPSPQQEPTHSANIPHEQLRIELGLAHSKPTPGFPRTSKKQKVVANR